MSKKLRTHDEVVLEQLQNPEMAKAYLDVAVEEYEQDGDLAFFLEALRNVVEAREGKGTPLLKPYCNTCIGVAAFS